MPTRSTLSLMNELVKSPESFWHGSERFHSRNRVKVRRALSQIGETSGLDDLVARMVEILERRAVLGTRNLLAMSNGSSGCHYLGELLNEFPGFQMTDEVYFPPDYIEAVRTSDDPDAWMALDFLDLLHTGRLDSGLIETTVVNIGHLRPDARPATLREAGYTPRFLLLLRNPYDVALGRAFRKEAYRSEVDPDASDDEYLRKQASYTASFLTRTRREQWDVVLRYEDLVGSPIAALRDLSLALGKNWQLDEIDGALRKYDPNRGSPESLSTNLNTKPRQPVTLRHARILQQQLKDVANDFGYDPPNRIAISLDEKRAELLLPLYAEDGQYTEERFRAIQGGRIQVFRSQPETDLVDDPEWIADPVSSKTWRLYYHSLSWLLALAWGADHSDDVPGAVAEIKRIVFSYIRANVSSSPRDEMAWDDHAAADRLTMLSHLKVKYLEETFTTAERNEYEEALQAHISRLESYYSSRKWISSNHGLFHAIALLNVSLTSDSMPAQRSREIGERYLIEVLENMIDVNDGVSLEQSVAYHSINLILLRRIAKFLRSNSIDGHERLGHIAGLMVEFNLAIRGSGNARIAIGDTPFGDKIPEHVLAPETEEFTTERVAHVLSGGREGLAFPRLLIYPSVGWAVFREGEVHSGNEPATRAIFTFSASRGPHGHFDALSFSLQHAGENLLIDSGGPYSYGDPLRFGYFAAPRGHNTVLVDDNDHQAGASLVASGDIGDASYVIAHHDGYPEVRLARAVVHYSPRTFVIVDGSSASIERVRFSTRWHLSPEAQISEEAGSDSHEYVVKIHETTARIMIRDLNPRKSRIVRGSEDGTPAGWVTAAVDTKTESPTIDSETNTDQLFSVTMVSIGESDVQCTLQSSSCELVGPDGTAVVVRWVGKTLELAPTGD